VERVVLNALEFGRARHSVRAEVIDAALPPDFDDQDQQAGCKEETRPSAIFSHRLQEKSIYLC
jgi:hypothetical protein